MEDWLIVLLIIGIYIPTFIGFMIGLFRPKTGKKKVQDVSTNSVSEMFDTSSKGYKDIVKVKDNQIRSLQSKLNLVNKESEDQDESIMDEEPTWEDIKAMAKAEGINPLYLEIPLVKSQVKKLIKGMTIGEITENVGELKKLAESKGIKLGGKKDGKSEDPVAELLKQNPDAFS